MTKIFLIRHAEAEGNLFRVAHGQYDSTITPQGYRQLSYLRERFRDVPIDAVYGSDLTRTHTTASAIYVPKGLSFHPMPLLREVCLGPWEQMTWGEIQAADLTAYQNFNKRPDLWRLEGAETFSVVQERMLEGIRQIARDDPGGTVAVTSHGAALRALLGMLQGRSLAEIGSTPHGDNTAVSLLEVDGDQIRVVYRDDNSHVPAQLSTFGRQTWHKSDAATEAGFRFTWSESGGSLLADAMLEDAHGGHIRLVREAGALRITEYEVEPALRGRGCGVQLLGQAFKCARARGLEELRVRCGSSFAPYFRKYVFTQVVEEQGGETELSIDLRRQLRDIPPLEKN